MKHFFTLILFTFIQISYGQTVSLVSTYATGLGSIRGLDFDGDGNLYVASGSSIKKITPSGTQTTFVTESSNIWELKIDAANNIFIAQNDRISKIDMQGNQTVIASQNGYWYQGIALDRQGNIFTNSNLASQTPHILTPNGTSYTETAWGGTIPPAGYGIDLDANGWLYVSNIIPGIFTKTNISGIVTTIATGVRAMDCEVDPSGNIYLATQSNNSIKKVDVYGTVTMYAGTGTAGTTDGSLTTAQFSSPSYICLYNGDMYVSDNGSGNIRKISNVYTATSVDNNLHQDIPQQFLLRQNYPNPFNPSTTISYQLSITSNVKLGVFDLLGREVTTLVNEVQTAGPHQVTFDAHALSSGMYFYKLTAGNFTEVKKMTLTK